MKLHLIIIFLMFSRFLLSQEFLNGETIEEGTNKPVVSANLFWLNSTKGCETDTSGAFKIHFTSLPAKLIISHAAFITDTIEVISANKKLIVKLRAKVHEAQRVSVSVDKPSIETDYFGARNTVKITQKELVKAACCNLSESFETNAAVDVSFTDAVTGIKQIEMLGLSGIYSQTTLENIPFLRGLLSNVGLSFIPGSWINSINVSKGLGSVANGYEAITGQIDVDLEKPFSEDGKPLFINLYGDYDSRYEGNLNYRLRFSENLSSINLLHFSSRKHNADLNKDSFMDMPQFDFLDLMQRWQLHTEFGLESQFGVQFVSDNKNGGTILNHENIASLPMKDYDYENKNRFISIFAKNGFILDEHGEKSFGLQLSYNNFSNSSKYGMRNYEGKQESFYLNFLLQSYFEQEVHKYRAGFSMVYDKYDEKFDDNNFIRSEKVPGVFFEYTYTPDPTFSLIAGLRADYHNFYKLMITPRIHARYSPDEDWVIRGAAGMGYRTAGILAENSSAFISNRKLEVLKNNDFGFGLDQEKAYIFGASLTHYFVFNYQTASISVDYYRTNFLNAVIPDIDTDPQKIIFSSVNNGGYSNSFQTELNFKPVPILDVRLAYRYLDVRQNINGEFLTRPFTSKHRAMLTTGWLIFRNEETGNKFVLDMTLNWFGEKRIPSTIKNPVEYRVGEFSPAFIVLNGQVSYSFSEGFDLYIGGENLLDFRQNNPIISAEDPMNKYFDASLIWGPLQGRMFYAGLRYNLN